MKHLLIAALLASAVSTGFGQITSTFTRLHGTGASGRWLNTANWSSGVPGAGDTAVLAIEGLGALEVDIDRTVANFNVLVDAGIDRFSTNGQLLTVTNNFDTALSGSLQIRRIGLQVNGNFNVNRIIDFGVHTVGNSNDQIYGVSVANTNLNSGGVINISKIVTGNTVNFGNLVITGGTLNLTAGAGANGSDITVENVVSVTRLHGASGGIAAGKVDSKGALHINGSSNGTFQGTITNGATDAVVRLTKSGVGTQELTNTNTYSGATLIDGGTLLLSGSGSINNTSAITINGGRLASASTVALNRNVVLSAGTFRHSSVDNYAGNLTFTAGTLEGTNWNGNLGGLTIGEGQHLSPGDGVGMANTTSQTWAGGGSYDWQIHDASGVAGTGFDSIVFSSTLDLTDLTAENRFNINIWSLSGVNPETNGDATNFGSNSWLLASANSISIGAVDVNDLFDINLDGVPGFTNPNDGVWSISLGGGANNQLFLNYSVIPEPGASLLLMAGAATLLFRRKRGLY